MPGYKKPIRVAAEVDRVPIGPGDGGAALADHFVQVHRRHQGVIDDNKGRARWNHAAGQETIVVLVAAEPIPAMEKNVNWHSAGRGALFGRGGGGGFRQVDIQRFLGAGPIGNVKPGVEIGQHRIGLSLIASMNVGVFRHPGAIIVLGVQSGLVIALVQGGVVHGAPFRLGASSHGPGRQGVPEVFGAKLPDSAGKGVLHPWRTSG